MFSYYPRANPYYAPSHLGYAPAAHYGGSPATFFGDDGRGFPRRRPEENAWMRSARRNPFGFQQPRAFSQDPKEEDDEEDLYDQKRRAYLQAKQYEQELRRAQELEAQGRMRHAQEQQRRKAPPQQQQTSPEPDFEEDILSTHESSEAVPPSKSNDTVSQEQLDAAAIVIQQAWRRHLAFRRIHSLESEFETLKSTFTFPSALDFIPPSPLSSRQPISLPTGSTWAMPSSSSTAKLAYTKNNAPLHAHVEALSRLLVKLDEVDSCGLKSIRERRKAVVRSIEDEAESLEARWRGVWAAYQAKSSEQEDDSDDEFFDVVDMVLDDNQDASMSEDIARSEGEVLEKSAGVERTA
ncbi:hypothetical protein DL96DRAFT_1715974 [Flagelloscypha sp. PMI_526]|nr:hypothetical protein DL96DRAFT_1715974 [Flagelloscypha sp. PMI_526]